MSRFSMFYKIAQEVNKNQIHQYYQDVYQDMAKYMQGKRIMGIQMVPYPVFRKYEKGKPIVIDKFDPQDKDNHKNFFYYPDKHYVDFHIIHGNKTDIIPVDIDPNKVPDHKVKAVTKAVKRMMKNITDDVEVFHTGGRGYHVVGKLDKEISTTLARRLIDLHLQPIVKTFSYTTFGRPPKEGEVRIDTSTFHPGGSIRVPYSINYKTLRPSTKVDL